MRTCSAMPLSAHMLLPNKESNSGTESAGTHRIQLRPTHRFPIAVRS